MSCIDLLKMKANPTEDLGKKSVNHSYNITSTYCA